MNIAKYILPIILAFSSVIPATAQDAPNVVRITFDPGGSLLQRIELYAEARKEDVKFIVDGPCLSACTLLTGLAKRGNVCSTDYGLLGFHSAAVVNSLTGEVMYSSEGTRLLWHMYPADVRELLYQSNWEGPSDHPNLIYIPAQRFFLDCREVEWGHNG